MLSDQHLRSLESGLTWAMKLKKRPQAVAKEIVNRIGKHQARISCQTLTVEQFCATLTRAGIASDLTGPEGRKYLERVLLQLQGLCR